MSAHHPGCKWHGHVLRHEVSINACMCGRFENALKEAQHLARELVEVLEERNRARDIAVTLEQEIAACPVLNHRPIRG
jgi:hypothetical protein